VAEDGAVSGLPADIPGVRVRRLEGGGVELYYPPFRQPLLWLIVIAVGALCVGAGLVGTYIFANMHWTVGLLAGDAPLVAAAFGLLVALLGLAGLGGSLTVRATAAGIGVERRLFGIPSRYRQLPANRIAEITMKIEMAVGQPGRERARYYRLKARGLGGHKLTVGDGIPGEANAQRLRRLLLETCGLAP
jgi:hypothetical protein